MFPPYFFVVFLLLCLLPIVFVPLDIFTIMIWSLGFLVALISAISIIIKVMRLSKTAEDRQAERSQQQIWLVRPVMTVVIFSFAILCVRFSQRLADNYAIEVGNRMHAVCNAQKVCSERVDGWQDGEKGDWYSSMILYGKLGPRFRVTYSVADDRQSFKITVRHNIDEGFTVCGGVNEKFEAKLWGPRQK